MSQDLISHNPDLKRLRDEGFQVEARDGLFLVHGVPYVNSGCQIKYGVLVSELELAGNKTVKPQNHVISFRGEHPCNKDGTPIKQIQHQSETKTLKDDIVVDHSFSNKPPDGYPDYYAKFTRY